MIDPDFDPYAILMQDHHNIGQLVLAVNQQSELVKQLSQAATHQQETIQQLTLQNRRLIQIFSRHSEEIQEIRQELARLNTDQNST
jgi:hypothetical protein